ncbi:MAG: hypothetical protein GPJ54_03285 [Candidatus Heimdallarchaeota archaeon]|nr:hypothetical protein [Candidatus Heimdallarchaeota archaeon]
MIADFYIVAFVLAGILSIGMGSIVIMEATKIYRKARRSRNWNSTLGEIIEKKVSKEMYRHLPIRNCLMLKLSTNIQ